VHSQVVVHIAVCEIVRKKGWIVEEWRKDDGRQGEVLGIYDLTLKHLCRKIWNRWSLCHARFMKDYHC